MKQLIGYSSQTLPQEECQGALLAPEFVVEHWEAMKKELDRIPHTWAPYWTKESMFECLTSGHWQAWGFGPTNVIRVTVFTTIALFPIGPVLQITLAFGNSLDALLPVMEATFERVAAVGNCVRCEIVGRPGWERKLRKFKRIAVVLSRDVEREKVH